MAKTLSGKDLSWIGIGSYGVGGFGHRSYEFTNDKSDAQYIEALEYQFKIGMNFSEIASGYGHGNCARVFAKAIKDSALISREDLFLTSSFYPTDFESFDQILDDIDQMHEVFDTDYFDSMLVTQSLCVEYGFIQIVGLLKRLLKEKRIRYVSLSNGSPKFIEKFHSEFGELFFAHETHLSFEIRVNQEKDLFDQCRGIGVENIIWRPLRKNSTQLCDWPLLKDLASKYKKTQNQIVLNWMNYLGLKPMSFSTNIKHIQENFDSHSFKMSDQEYKEMTDFRVPDQEVPIIDWEKSGEGVSMATFVIGYE